MVRRLRYVDDLLAPAVATTIAELELTDQDAAVVRLAERYAATIDDAAQIAAELDDMDYHEDTVKRVAALSRRVDAQAVIADLGPKLLACLEQLGATPAARSRLKGGATGAGTNRLDAARQARRA